MTSLYEALKKKLDNYPTDAIDIQILSETQQSDFAQLYLTPLKDTGLISIPNSRKQSQNQTFDKRKLNSSLYNFYQTKRQQDSFDNRNDIKLSNSRNNDQRSRSFLDGKNAKGSKEYNSGCCQSVILESNLNERVQQIEEILKKKDQSCFVKEDKLKISVIKDEWILKRPKKPVCKEREMCECGTQTAASKFAKKSSLEITVDDSDKCQEHKDSELKFIDIDTNELLCIYCAMKVKQVNPFAQIVSTEEKLSISKLQLNQTLYTLRENQETLQRLREESDRFKKQQAEEVTKHYDRIIRLMQLQKNRIIENVNQVFRQNELKISSIDNLIRDQDTYIKQVLKKIEDCDVIEDYRDKFDTIGMIFEDMKNIDLSQQFNSEIQQIQLKKAVYISKNIDIEKLLKKIEDSDQIISTDFSFQASQKFLNLSVQESTSNQRTPLCTQYLSNVQEVKSTVTTQRKRQQSKNSYLQRLEVLSEDLKSYNNQVVSSESCLLSRSDKGGKENDGPFEIFNEEEQEFDSSLNQIDQKYQQNIFQAFEEYVEDVEKDAPLVFKI